MMQRVELNGRPTTQLGFGGSLLGSTAPVESRRLIAAAYDAGIRHFDVAPMYGFGKAESLLAQALGARLQSVTITTKYGLAPPPHSAWIAPVHRLAKQALKAFPALGRGIRAGNQSLTSNRPEPRLSAKEVQRSIAQSLKQLGIPAVDLLLLHEATPERLTDDRLLNTLREEQRAGRIRDFGIGSTRLRAEACLAHSPALCHVLQFEWSAFSADVDLPPQQKVIRHGSLGGNRLHFTRWLLSDPDKTSHWSQAVGGDLRQPGILDRLLLKAALVDSPGQIVLFSTRTLSRISENVETAGDRTLERPAQCLRALICQDYLPSIASTPPLHER